MSKKQKNQSVKPYFLISSNNPLAPGFTGEVGSYESTDKEKIG
jgi:hypothetical protein